MSDTKCLPCGDKYNCATCGDATSCLTCPTGFVLYAGNHSCVSRVLCTGDYALIDYKASNETCIDSKSCVDNVGYIYSGYCKRCKAGANCGSCSYIGDGACTSCQ